MPFQRREAEWHAIYRSSLLGDALDAFSMKCCGDMGTLLGYKVTTIRRSSPLGHVVTKLKNLTASPCRVVGPPLCFDVYTVLLPATSWRRIFPKRTLGHCLAKFKYHCLN